jgi:thioredoxin reductase
VVATDSDGRTNVAGLWAAGTCAGTSVHTIITAGDGARVAINLVSSLRGERFVDHEVMK